ncbi:NAD-dependent epimerase/dehydratase family protein [Natronolimnohabitans innermongolicus]|uniref:NAD-dependent epimerase/dehydratase n=1 Tax=Natronolimnohabitans innermongolicus JCM 12255 TaxID=1227499 RepID=L9XBD6_9EURY|nr:NAD(P)-dependent oxidoreductase [Natronolimnohabitans innermongolicus]ELY59015.1 NAD-dependent epimerase/dehydratase [Natronolimnohabitans innermongolicus JCM 12255]
MATQNVLVTGPFGEAGQALRTHLIGSEEYEFTLLDRNDHPDYETHVADISDYDAIRPAFEDQDAVIHLAAQSDAGAELDEVIQPNIVGTVNVLEAAEDAGVEKVIYASSQRVMGLYEEDNAPELYEKDHDLLLDHETLPKPDGFYGATKVFGENMGRVYARREGAPSQFFSIRISSVRAEAYDHPYGDAERGVHRGTDDAVDGDDAWDPSQTGSWERGSEEYEEMVDRLKASWTSQRDFAHLIECCLENETVTYDTFYAVSDNAARWFDTEHAKDVLGYEPQDDGSEWDQPPNVNETPQS